MIGWRRLVCKIFGHKKSVVWHMTKLTGYYCNRCKTWTKGMEVELSQTLKEHKEK